MDIRDFIAARLDDDEQVAHAAGSGEHWLIGRLTDRGSIIASDIADEVALASPSSRHHIAHWDPARVLAEIAAKRRRIERHSPGGGIFCGACEQEWPCIDVLNDASLYAEHPDFDPAWGLEA